MPTSPTAPPSPEGVPGAVRDPSVLDDEDLT